MLATIQPSYLLRLEDAHDKRAQVRRFAADLMAGARVLVAA